MMNTFIDVGNHVLIGRMLYVILALPLIYPVSWSVSAVESEYHNRGCGPNMLRKTKGTVTSPNYPHAYPQNINCMWVIESPPETSVTIRVSDLDIEEDGICRHEPCCGHAWLALPGPGGSRKLCGHNSSATAIVVSEPSVSIKFHASKVMKSGRGFNLTYSIAAVQEPGICLGDEVPCDEHAIECYNSVTQRCNGFQDCTSGLDEANCCGPDQYSCHSDHGCYSHQQKCDGRPDCVDFSDEIDCDINPFCGKGQALCGSSVPRCFNPILERCDGKMDCPYGEDEVSCNPACPGKIMCTNRKGCYSTSQRCNDIRNCHDDSDEAECPRELCVLMQGKFQCDNGRCIPEHEWCNGIDNCLDNSDEVNCIKNSVITAAIMGSLICGLLLVVAVGCMCRLYSLRLAVSNNYRIHQYVPPSRLRTTTPNPEDEFFNREPPPAYSVAVNECQQSQRIPGQANNSRLFTVTEQNQCQRHSSRRSSRRHSSNRRRSQRGSTGSNSSLSNPSGFGIEHMRNGYTHSAPIPSSCVPIPVSSTLETSLAAQSMIVSSQSADNKTNNASHNSITFPSISTISGGARNTTDLEGNPVLLPTLNCSLH